MLKQKLFIFVLILTSTPFITYAAMTQPFGGRILLTKIPAVNCFGLGTGPVVLMNNIMSAGSAAYSSATGGGAVNVASGIYGAIPYYTNSLTKVPKEGQWILGNYNIVPSFNTCSLYSIPFPVKKTTDYSLSKSRGF